MKKKAEIFATQGGGKVVWDGKGYVFVEKPKCPGFNVGDYMPEEWGIVGPINQ